jgi:hypothetical protein
MSGACFISKTMNYELFWIDIAEIYSKSCRVSFILGNIGPVHFVLYVKL